MRERTFFAALFLILLASRLCHIHILWAEEDLPMAAAKQMTFGKTLYRDVWFDKPPLLAAQYLAWGVRAGWVLRVAGALYALLACWLAYAFARDLWSRREGLWAAGLLGFFLIFDFPAVAIPLAADLTMLAPHLAAVWLAFRGRAFWSGIAAGIAFLINSKAMFVLATCAVWCLPAIPLLVTGFIAVNAVAAAWLAWSGALVPYLDEVWRWGFLYAGSTFLEHPIRSGIIRTADWLGFHSALVIAAVWNRALQPWRWKLSAWAVLSFAAAIVGWRFFPRYFFQVLPVLVIVASRGIVLMKRCRIIVLALLLIPLVRFGPRYVLLARDLVTGQVHPWSDVAMDQDSQAAARIVREIARPGDTLFVWGFRPDLFIYTGLPAATRFIDCQPLTGVPADRHLTQSAPVGADFTRANREELARSRPTIVMDGLSLYNPALAMSRYPELRPWLAQYQEVARTRTTVIYRLAVSVPFIGCASYGQTRKLEAPKGADRPVPLSPHDAQAFAYYQSADGIGLLAPRGWYCEGVSGSSGYALWISPKPIDPRSPGWGNFAGPGIEFYHITSENSGMYEVAEIIARVFPAYNAFARRIWQGIDLPFPSGPYPNDSLTYKSKTVVEYKTPAQTEGLGTHFSGLRKNDTPVAGAAILIGDPPDLLLLSVRLPRGSGGLTSLIVRHVEDHAVDAAPK